MAKIPEALPIDPKSEEAPEVPQPQLRQAIAAGENNIIINADKINIFNIKDVFLGICKCVEFLHKNEIVVSVSY